MSNRHEHADNPAGSTVVPSTIGDVADRSVPPEERKEIVSPNRTLNERSDTALSESTTEPHPNPAQYSEALARQRAIAQLFARGGGLPFVILSYVAEQGRVAVDGLLDMGPREDLFTTILDLYDYGFLQREHGTILLSSEGRRLLARAGLLNGPRTTAG